MYMCINTKQTSCHMQPAGAAAQAGGDLAQYNAPYKRGSVSGLSLPCPATASILLSAPMAIKNPWCAFIGLLVGGLPLDSCLCMAKEAPSFPTCQFAYADTG